MHVSDDDRQVLFETVAGSLEERAAQFMSAMFEDAEVEDPGILARFDQQDAALAALDRRMGRVEDGFARIDGSLGRLEQAMTDLTGRVIAMDERLGGVEGSVTDLTGRVIAMDERLGGVEGSVTDLTGRVVRVEDETTGLTGRVTRTEQGLTDLTVEVEALGAQQEARFDAQLATLEGLLHREIGAAIAAQTRTVLFGVLAVTAAMFGLLLAVNQVL